MTDKEILLEIVALRELLQERDEEFWKQFKLLEMRFDLYESIMLALAAVPGMKPGPDMLQASLQLMKRIQESDHRSAASKLIARHESLHEHGAARLETLRKRIEELP